MMSPTMWAGQRVQDFFAGCNWRGEPPKLPPRTAPEESVESESSAEINWLSLNLQDFIGKGNWKGIQLPKTRSTSAVLPQVSVHSVLSLTVSVQHFFQGMPWRGNPLNSLKMTPETPKKKSSLGEIPEASDDWTITDLSDLL